MSNKNYNRGRAFEYRVKKYFEDKGYLVVRSAGSKSPFDLVAIPTKEYEEDNGFSNVLLIQCKYGAKISKKERDKITNIDDNLSVGVSTVIAWAKPYKPIVFYDGRKLGEKLGENEEKILEIIEAVLERVEIEGSTHNDNAFVVLGLKETDEILKLFKRRGIICQKK